MAGSALYANMPTMPRNNRFADIQPEPQSNTRTRLHFNPSYPVETLPNAFPLSGWQSWAVPAQFPELWLPDHTLLNASRVFRPGYATHPVDRSPGDPGGPSDDSHSPANRGAAGHFVFSGHLPNAVID